jgi:hypothetical protein
MSEVCGDKSDNDCDGATDESDAVDASTWYSDCDGDGYSAGALGSGTRGCLAPPTTISCKTWTTREPSNASNTDCNDHSATHHPGADFDFPFTPGMAPPPNSTDYDLNCDGNAEVATPTFGGTYVIFDFGMPRQLVTFCGDASTTGCCITDAKGIAFCCGCNLGVHVECVNYRGDTNAWFRCR